jgi:hypothetical protein
MRFHNIGFAITFGLCFLTNLDVSSPFLGAKNTGKKTKKSVDHGETFGPFLFNAAEEEEPAWTCSTNGKRRRQDTSTHRPLKAGLRIRIPGFNQVSESDPDRIRNPDSDPGGKNDRLK